MILAAGVCIGSAPVRAQVLDATVRVDWGKPGQAVNAKLFGQNVPVSLSGFWDSTTGQMHPWSEAMVKQIRPSVMRFPGGSLSDIYLWEDGLSQRALGPVKPNDRAVTLAVDPRWTSGSTARFLGLSAGRHGDPFRFLNLQGSTIRGVEGITKPHPAGVPLRLDRRQGQPEWFQNSLGSFEIIKLAEVLGSDLLITVNFGTGIDRYGNVSVNASLDQRIMRAMAWVAFMNGSAGDGRPIGVDPEGNDWQTVGHWARKRVEGGRVEPVGLACWEVGNEPFWASEAGHTTAEDYARGFVRFARAMKTVDPAIRVGAAAMSDPTARGEMDPRDAWNPTLLRIAGNDMDFLAVHPYYPSALHSQTPFGSETWYLAIMAGASHAAMHLEKNRELLEQTIRPSGRRLEMVVSEYGIWPADSKDPRDFSNMARAVYDADLLLYLLHTGERFGLVAATGWNLQSSTETALIRHDWASGLGTARPQYHAFHMLRDLEEGRMLPVTVDTPVFDSPRVGNMDAMKNVPVLHAAAFVGKGDRLRLIVINRHLRGTVRAAVQVNGDQTRWMGSLRVLAGPGPSAHNEDHARNVQPASKTVTALTQPFVQEFPPHSITLMELEGAGDGGSAEPLMAPRAIRNADTHGQSAGRNE
jgi:alpha-N-arabinofuranosidase